MTCLRGSLGCTCPRDALDRGAVIVVSIDCPVHGSDARAALVEAIDEGRVIQEQPPGRCELCGKVAETRPYGPNGEEVCFPCGMKDEAAARRAFDARLGGAGA